MSKRMPTLFLGHGSPMIALENNELTKELTNVGKEIINKFNKPKAILSISAHWYKDNTYIQTSKNPKQAYDMYGFPEELYNLKYEVSGSESLSNEVLNLLTDVSVDNSWGIDHGIWTPLVHLFPSADIPIVQLSLNSKLSPTESFNLAKNLSTLRDKGYLILGSGNIVHNLYKVQWDNPEGTIETISFNDTVIDKVKNKDFNSLIDYTSIKYSDYAVPTPEHYLPLLYILGCSSEDDVKVFNNECELGSISMTSFAFGI